MTDAVSQTLEVRKDNWAETRVVDSPLDATEEVQAQEPVPASEGEGEGEGDEDDEKKGGFFKKLFGGD